MPRLRAVEKGRQTLDGRGRLAPQDVAGRLERDDLGAVAETVRPVAGLLNGDDSVLPAPQQQRGCLDVTQPPLQLRLRLAISIA